MPPDTGRCKTGDTLTEQQTIGSIYGKWHCSSGPELCQALRVSPSDQDMPALSHTLEPPKIRRMNSPGFNPQQRITNREKLPYKGESGFCGQPLQKLTTIIINNQQ
jgi:hypothetical protein